jgi:hypothetical protein
VIPDYLSDRDLRDLGLDPECVPALCPWATELTALDGTRCWAAADLAHLLEHHDHHGELQ